MCCRTNDTNADTCATEPNLLGLCMTKDEDFWRESCTDKQWKDDQCVQLCLNTDGRLWDNYDGLIEADHA
jgi:hypothetical protein